MSHSFHYSFLPFIILSSLTMSAPSSQNPSPLRPLVHSPQRTQYQFPVYRFINWLAIGSYLLGLVAMYFLLGMFGIPAPLGWAALVIMFTFGILLLNRPKLLLQTMMFYFLLMPSNRLLGLLSFPLPEFMDELFFIPLVAVIVMNWINGRQIKEGIWFSFGMIALAILSWYANGKPPFLSGFVATFVLMKSFILFYYCRLCFPEQRSKAIWNVAELYIYYAAIQLFYNFFWHRSFWLRYHPDVSGGVFGPDGGAAHIVGYMCVIALFLLMGWWLGPAKDASRLKRISMIAATVLLVYDLVFMTDTKHALVLAPIALAPVFFHSMFSARARITILTSTVLFVVLGFFWFIIFSGRIDFWRLGRSFLHSPKGEYMRAVTVDFSNLVRFPLLGAGPGNFGSDQAIRGKAPLARQYIIPYTEEARRLKLSHGRTGSRTGGSIIAFPHSTMLCITSEFGWLGFFLYYGFYAWIAWRLWKRSHDLLLDHNGRLISLSLFPSVGFIAMCMIIAPIHTVPMLMFPFWILIALVWDMQMQAEEDNPLDEAKDSPALLLLSASPSSSLTMTEHRQEDSFLTCSHAMPVNRCI